MANTGETLKKEMAEQLIELLKDKEFKHELIDAINKDIDIPVLNEKTEKKVFNSLYKVLVNQVENVLHKKVL
mgnify:FL=1|jgi:hypothetical protein|tara:strand:+ start:127 stop:342 length:216 start_codon:yes stop_codon:yes gene_type:complete